MNKTEIIHGEPSLRIRSKMVDCAVTLRGGHMAPVKFKAGKGWIEPYSLAPWSPGECEPKTPTVLQVLRGDFFCMPFGANKGVIHGQPANDTWKPVQVEGNRMEMEMVLKSPIKGKLTKRIELGEDAPAIYQSHIATGVKGNFNLGYHAILQFPPKTGAAQIRTSPIRFGSVLPPPYGNPEIGEYGTLKPGARFKSLDRVPLADGGYTSMASYPARNGFEDIAMISSKKGDFAWTSATFSDYVWLSLKDPRVLASTLFWMTNGGRHFPPWNGKHRFRMGIEELTSGFCFGLELSRKSHGVPKEIPTTLHFDGKEKAIRSIHLVFPVPATFQAVADVVREKNGIVVKSETGKTVSLPVQWNYLYTGELV